MVNLDFSNINTKISYSNLMQRTFFEEQIWTIIYSEDEEEKYFNPSEGNFNLRLKPGEYDMKFLISTNKNINQIIISKKIILETNQNYKMFIQNDRKETIEIYSEMKKIDKLFKKYYKLILLSLVIALLLTNSIIAFILIIPSSALYVVQRAYSASKIFNQTIFKNPSSLNIIVRVSK